MLFGPMTSATLLVGGVVDVAAVPVVSLTTTHVVPAGIVELPFTVKPMFMVEPVVLIGFEAGETIATDGNSGGRTMRVEVPVPYTFVQETEIELAVFVTATELTVVEVDAKLTPVVVFVTTQVVPGGIVVAPLTVYETLIGELVTGEPGLGDVITTVGGTPRLTVTLALPWPYWLVQVTMIAFAPMISGTEFVVVEVDGTLPPAGLLMAQNVPAGIVDPPWTVTYATFIVEAVV